ncbi:oxaloacetate decarboxylase alpha subunit [Enterococcus sp. PF1-24]|uniref:pyruvate carboxylase subunit B n=1 Tax=unclassified Enterococcus TaxID=2608891 RepID=UPI002474550B|nr:MULTISPECIES: pyruvate carboxylase subunit B [unclassified Enterococcus]MDH6364604.1 oxaloacetate decarboxylase alpha subunit [Enterococcus sp. PFB1-1]MDH6401705.1 oxaloacetate decarboxylase alpha subunit [Enterococcus sp. PF1-24]
MGELRKVGFTETVLRDAHQSLMATRMTLADMEPILPVLDQVGFDSLECWGGATFDACIRFLKENPWERLRRIKELAPNTPLQMLLRGQNLLGYRHYADDVVEKFVEKSAENGIDIFRIFDALNDCRNLAAALKAVKKTGKEAQLTIAYTTSEVHTVAYYQQLVEEMTAMGADSICIKDMAGILTPTKGRELVLTLKSVTDLPIIVHTHCTSGIASMTYQAVIEAGASRIDTAISPFSEGTSQPATESMALVLQEAGYQVALDLEKLNEAAAYFRKIKDKYLDNGTLEAKMLTPDPRALIYQVPGGMLSNMYSQLSAANALDKYEAVLQEVPKVRADLGYPPLVTPLSQMVGTQATMNVIAGERYQMVSNEVKAYLVGEYGKSPVAITEDFRRQLVGDTPVIDERPANRLAPEFAKLTAEIGDLAENEEDVLIYALFPQVGKDYLLKRQSATSNPAEGTVAKEQPIKIYGFI